MNLNAEIYVVGHRGLVGSVLVRQLHASCHGKIELLDEV